MDTPYPRADTRNYEFPDPVTSLSETLLALPGAENEEMKQGLETIHSTGKGLINFVMSYRKLTRLPSPEPSLFYVRPFPGTMIRLAQHQHPCPQHHPFHPRSPGRPDSLCRREPDSPSGYESAEKCDSSHR